MLPHRLGYAACAVAIIALGLVVHRVDLRLYPVARDMLGDALWAAMVTCWLAALFAAMRRRHRALLALAICFGVEFSQMYRAPWLDAVRGTLPGHLVLGSGYDSRDLLAYFLGVAAATAADGFFWRQKRAAVCARAK